MKRHFTKKNRGYVLAAILFFLTASPSFAEEVAPLDTDKPNDLIVTAQRAQSNANWWKYKFKTDPSFSEIPFNYYPRTALRQQSVEEKAR
jgi:hypothetical protein